LYRPDTQVVMQLQANSSPSVDAIRLRCSKMHAQVEIIHNHQCASESEQLTSKC
jgi:hypothetical protein